MDEELKITRKEDGQTNVKVQLKESNSSTNPADLSVLPLQGLLGLQNPSSKEREMLNDVWDYLLSENKDGTDTERLYQFKVLENRLGLPSMGESRLSRVHRFIKISRQAEETAKLRDAMAGGMV